MDPNPLQTATQAFFYSDFWQAAMDVWGWAVKPALYLFMAWTWLCILCTLGRIARALEWMVGARAFTMPVEDLKAIQGWLDRGQP